MLQIRRASPKYHLLASLRDRLLVLNILLRDRLILLLRPLLVCLLWPRLHRLLRPLLHRIRHPLLLLLRLCNALRARRRRPQLVYIREASIAALATKEPTHAASMTHKNPEADEDQSCGDSHRYEQQPSRFCQSTSCPGPIAIWGKVCHCACPGFARVLRSHIPSRPRLLQP
jgi:hypothetical protein